MTTCKAPTPSGTNKSSRGRYIEKMSSPVRGTGQLFSIERNGSSVCGAEKKDSIFTARNEGRSLQGASARKGNPRGNPEFNGKGTSKYRNRRIYPVLPSMKGEGNHKVTEKYKPKDPKLSVRQESQTSPYTAIIKIGDPGNGSFFSVWALLLGPKTWNLEATKIMHVA